MSALDSSMFSHVGKASVKAAFAPKATTSYFPKKVLLSIFSNMETTELLKAAAVDQRWRRIVLTPELWTTLIDPPLGLLPRLSDASEVTALDISITGAEHFRKLCTLLPRFLPQLEELSIYLYSRDAGSFPFESLWDVLCRPAPLLRTLCLKGEFSWRGIPAGSSLLGGKAGKLRTLILGGFRPVNGKRGYLVSAFSGVRVLDIAGPSLAQTGLTIRSQYPSLRELTLHNVHPKLMEHPFVAPLPLRKLQIHFLAIVLARDAENWLRAANIEGLNEVFATLGEGFVLGSFEGRNIRTLACTAVGGIFRMETRADGDYVRTALVARDDVERVLGRLVGLGKMSHVASVRFEGVDAMRLLPSAHLEAMPILDTLDLVMSFEDIRSFGDAKVQLFDVGDFNGWPRLNNVTKFFLRGKKGFGVNVDREQVRRLVKAVTPAVTKVKCLNIAT
ncbi:hypothetical protein AURDEDRAFT_173954 [Auricularia subglabra TFB-10046 SS5]|uniref:F-box domain-containing protein n=1 Tax=Auricularia subglabra (strain TFB-10046 / SS5) TaxID=717982 RepID=J0LGY5_AURST|nr:hypothetical protein AURDEDRAFT_173954 [Auricularia subglabra TFB-10046 SS5]